MSLLSSPHHPGKDLRKRTKYLSHVPISCSVTFCEIDWSDPRVNVARPRVSVDDYTPCSSLVVEFLSAEQERFPLLPADRLSQWDEELRVRKRKHITRNRKDSHHHKGQSRSIEETPLSPEELAMLQERRNSTPSELFDFRNEDLWQRLPTNSLVTEESATVDAKSEHVQAPTLGFDQGAAVTTADLVSPVSPVDATTARTDGPSPLSADTSMAGTSSSFARVLGKSADEMLREKLKEMDTTKGKRKKKIVLMSNGGRRGW